MRRLFLPGYYCGFSNNKMSLDIAIVLAHLTGRVLVPYRFRLPRRAPIDPAATGVIEPLQILDLYDLPIPWSDEHLFKTWVSVPGSLNCAWAPVFDSVFHLPSTSTNDADFQQFRNGRHHVYTLSEAEQQATDLHITTHSLGHYSYFFYLDTARRREVVDLMNRLQPKRPYREAADRIATSLGSFNAIHVRRGDFLSNELSRKKITRAASVSGQELVANLAARMDRDVPLVICTDGSPREELFGPIQKYFRDTIFLDQYLRENQCSRELLTQLPRYDESVEVLLTQLVASRAAIFAGTLFSTFTALIHRLRAFDRQESSFLYCYNDFLSPLVHYERCEFMPVSEGPYSWNRIRYPVSPDAYSWLREWPEAALSTPRREDEGLPSGAIDLLAGGAELHGTTLRHLEVGGQPLVGHWSDPTEFVTWNLAPAAARTYSVEIRYACSDEAAGSRYRVGLTGGDQLEGQVWNTGSWVSLSPWLPLGRISIPAGSGKLAVRSVGKAAGAVMNLSAVRLVPTERTG